jgi:Ca2+-binding EF-hand superfamily protein
MVFERLDTYGNGLIEYKDFEENLIKTEGSVNQIKIKDSFTWEIDIIYKIKDYAVSNNLSIDDLFKVLDKDFDGKISQQDLRSFIIEIL